MKKAIACGWWLAIGVSCAAFAAETLALPVKDGFTRLKYNNPEATSYLKAGLWAYPVPLDGNGDGKTDIYVSCHDWPYNGLYQFLNIGTGEMPLFAKGQRVADGEHYPSLAGTCGENLRRVTLPGNLFTDFAATHFSKPVAFDGVPVNVHNRAIRANVWRIEDYDGDGTDDLIIGVGDWGSYGIPWENMADPFTKNGDWLAGQVEGYVYVCRGNGKKYGAAEMVKLTNGKPLMTEGSPWPMLADWDGDGDLDIICGSFVDSFTFFENVGTRKNPEYAPGRAVKAADGADVTMDLAMITPTAFDWNKDGKLDIICGDEDGRVAFIKNTGTLKEGVPVFEQPRYFRQQADNLGFGVLVTPCVCDFDNDGDEDIVAGNSAGYVAFIENLSGPKVADPKWAEPKLLKVGNRPIRILAGIKGSIQGPVERKWGYTAIGVDDWDGDGLKDVVLNSITGDVVWYRNLGEKGSLGFAPAEPVEVEWDGPQPELKWGWRKPGDLGNPKALLTQWRTTPYLHDWNRDGLVDLIMLDTEGYLSFFERALQNGKRILKSPKRIFLDEKGNPLRLAPNRAGLSGRRKFCLMDWDGDGLLDIVANSWNAEVYLQCGKDGSGTRFRNIGTVSSRRMAGHSTSPTSCDFDGDGRRKLLLGAEDGHFYRFDGPQPEGRALCDGVNPAWSPDGKSIAFQYLKDGSFTLGIYDLEAGKITWVDNGEGHAAFPAWAADGSLVYTFGNDKETMFAAWKANSQSGYGLRVREKDGTIRTLTSGRCRDYTPVVSPDGKTVYFTTSRFAKTILNRSISSHIAAIPLAGGEIRKVVDPTGGEDSSAAHPAVSPDGKYLAWSSLECILDGAWTPLLARMDDLKSSCLLTDPDIIGYSPRWHPNSRYVAFTGFRRGDPAWGVYVADITTGACKRLASGENPCFSPDGTQICFDCKDRLVVRAFTAADYPQGIAGDRKMRPASHKIWSAGPITAPTTFTPPKSDFAFGSDKTFYVRLKGVWKGSGKLMKPVNFQYEEHPLGFLFAIRESGKFEMSLRQTNTKYGPLLAAKRLKKGETFEVVGVRHEDHIYLSLNGEVTYRPYPIGFMSIDRLKQIKLGEDCEGPDGVDIEYVEVGTGWPEDVVAAKLRKEVVK